MQWSSNRHDPYVIQILYNWSLLHDPEATLNALIQAIVPSKYQKATRVDVHTVIQHVEEIDANIDGHTPHRRFERLSCTDQAILRLSTWKLIYAHHIPTETIICQSVRLAELYTSSSMTQFINAILHTLATDCRPISPTPTLEVSHA